jgi:hypothetical protein
VNSAFAAGRFRMHHASKKVGEANDDRRQTIGWNEQSPSALANAYMFSPVAQLAMDRNGCIRQVNVAAAVLLNGERSQLLNMPLIAFVDKADVRRFLEHLAQALRLDKKIRTRLTLAGSQKHKT